MKDHKKRKSMGRAAGSLVLSRSFLMLFLLSSVVVSVYCDDEEGGSSSGERKRDDDVGPVNQPNNQRLVNLKHRRYKSVRDNTTTAQDRLLPTPSIIHHDHIILPHPDHPHAHPLPNLKSPRGGFELQKSPPDLQFGLAFTVPFISLSTEKLIHGVAAGKGFGDSVSSLLKLNFSGLFLAAIVGIIAIAGLFLPTLFGNGGLGGVGGWGGLGGWGNSLLDGLNHQFTENLYNDYENGWANGGKGSLGSGWGKDFDSNGRRNGRKLDLFSAFGMGLSKIGQRVKKQIGIVEDCALERVCGELADGSGALSSVVMEFKDSDVWDGPRIPPVLKKIRSVVVDKEVGHCKKGNGACDGLGNVVEMFGDVVKSWGGSGGGGGGEASGEGSGEGKKTK